MIVTFIGHGKLNIDDELKSRIKAEIEKCIDGDADTFYLGGYGDFDFACARIVKEVQKTFPEIKSYLITPYLNPVMQKKLKYIERLNLYDGSIYPEIEEVPYKFAISKRNEWMVEQADVIIAFVDHDWGGAATTLQYAKRKKKTIINLAD